MISRFSIKYSLNILSLLLVAISASSNRNDREPEYTPVAIHRQFNTQSKPVKLSELRDFSGYKSRLFIVNSIDELPVDQHFSTDDFIRANINFSDYSLIVAYQLIIGEIVAYHYDWCYNNWDERYQLNTTYDRVRDSEYEDGEIENFTYLRSAVLVRRIPSNANCVISMGVYEL